MKLTRNYNSISSEPLHGYFGSYQMERCFSHYFLATNGVKQGCVLSPVLFCVYIDDMLRAPTAAGEPAWRWALYIYGECFRRASGVC